MLFSLIENRIAAKDVRFTAVKQTTEARHARGCDDWYKAVLTFQSTGKATPHFFIYVGSGPRQRC
jgi:hypothetical protein